MHWWLPPNASTYGGDIDALFYLILYITGAVFLIVEVAIVVFLFRYRSREGRKAAYILGSTRAEIVWTVVPAVIVVMLGLLSQRVWSEIRSPDRFPADAMPLEVTAQQFEWRVRYPGADGVFGTGDDILKRNLLHVPVGRPVLVSLTSRDVIHSFFVPQFRVKQDAVPGMKMRFWFEATRTGEFELGCAELCGLGHYRMRARVVVQTPEAFRDWLAGEAGGGS